MKKITLIIILLIISLSLGSCKRSVESYDDIEEIVYRSILTQKQESYYVYFYRPYVSDSNYCPACEKIKPHLITYANSVKKGNNSRPVYLINTNNKVINEGMMRKCNIDEECENIALNAKVYTEIEIAYVPYLILVQNGVVTKIWNGSTNISEELAI